MFENAQWQSYRKNSEEPILRDSPVHEMRVAKLEVAEAKPTLRRRSCNPQGKTPTTTIRLDPTDIERAKLQAQERGLKYQTYLKMLIHESLRRADVRM